MKRLSWSAALLGMVALATATPALSSNVGVSVSIGQPGFYGQIDIGHFAPPVIYAQPMVIERVPRGVVYAPMYLRVPPGHYNNWSRYCGGYGACGRPVYFVQDSWYNRVYVPYYRTYRSSYYGRPYYGDGYRYNDRYDGGRDWDRGDRYYDNRNYGDRNYGNRNYDNRKNDNRKDYGRNDRGDRKGRHD